MEVITRLVMPDLIRHPDTSVVVTLAAINVAIEHYSELEGKRR
jgi:hypothetical protein